MSHVSLHLSTACVACRSACHHQPIWTAFDAAQIAELWLSSDCKFRHPCKNAVIQQLLLDWSSETDVRARARPRALTANCFRDVC